MPYSRTQQTSNLNAIRAKTLELALYSTNPTASDTGSEITGGGYVRQSISFTTPQAVIDGVYMTNTATLSFPTATGDYSAPVSHFAVREVGGGMMFYGTTQELGLDTSRTIRAGDIFRVAANTLVHKELD